MFPSGPLLHGVFWAPKPYTQIYLIHNQLS